MQNTRQFITLTSESIEKLKCTFCRKYLSVSPVDLTRGLCGRCNKTSVRSEAYEEIAQYVLFPCTYSICKEKLIWGRVKEHEENCPHKTFICPVESCDYQCDTSSVCWHFQNHHITLNHDGHVPLKIAADIGAFSGTIRDEKQVHLIKFGRNFFFVFVYYEGFQLRFPSSSKLIWNEISPTKPSILPKKKCYLGVFALNTKVNIDIKFEVTQTITRYSKKFSYTQKNQKIITFDEKFHCFKCMNSSSTERTTPSYDKCVVPHHYKHLANFLPVEFDFHASTDVFQIDIIRDEGINQTIKEKLKCPNCSIQMVAPIYMCDAGHSICGTCKQHISTCPYCGNRIVDRRNFIMEELAKTVKML